MRPRRLKKYDINVTKDYDGGDDRQVPASGVTITPYRRGVWANQDVTLTTSYANLTVREIGQIQAGDTLQLASDLIAGAATPVLTVHVSTPYGTPSPFNWDVLYVAVTTGTTMDVDIGDRLVPTNNLPAVYSESSGVASLGSFVTDAAGYAKGYIEAEGNAIDVKVSGGGVDSAMYYDEWLGGSEEHVIYADDYATIQDAIDVCPLRGIVQLSSRQYAPTSTITIDKSITIRGEKIGANAFSDETAHGTVIKQYSTTTDVFSCTTDTANYVTIQNLRIQGAGAAGTGGNPGAGNGIMCKSTTGAMAYWYFMDLEVTGCGNHGIYLEFVDFPYFERVTSQSNYADGFHLRGASGTNITSQVRMLQCYANNNEDFGVYCNNVIGVTIDGIGIQSNHQEPTYNGVDPKTSDGYPNMFMETTHEVSIQRIDFEDFADDGTDYPNTDTALVLKNCRGVVMGGNGFGNATVYGRGIYIRENNDGINIWGNRVQNLAKWIELEDATDDSENIFLGPNGYTGDVTTCYTLPSVASRADHNVIIADTAGSVLSGVITHDRGLIIPIFTTTNRPTAAAANEGSLIYNSTSQKLNMSTGSAWEAVTSV